MMQQYGLTLRDLLQWETSILETQKSSLKQAEKNVDNEEMYKYYMHLYDIGNHQHSLLMRLIQQAKGEQL